MKGHRTLLSLLSVATLGAALLCTTACSKKSEAPKGERHQGLTGGKLVFSDDFERADLGPDWKKDGGGWTIESGWVREPGTAQNAGLWLNKQLPERARIEFKVRSDMPKNGTFRGDLKCEVFCSEPEHQKGYVLIFGGWENQLNVVARLDEHGKDRIEASHRKVVAGQVYEWAIVRTDGTLRWYIDGKPFMRYEDPSPLPGRFFGFNNWASNVAYDDIKVYEL